MMIPRALAVEKLRRHIGEDLFIHAEKFGIRPFINDRQNKGWKGLTLERMIGIEPNTSRAPNGLDFELKSVAFQCIQGKWRPRETMAIGMIRPDELQCTPFFKSHVWEKLKSLIFCAVSWHGRHSRESRLLKVESFDFYQDAEIVREIADDYEFIRQKLKIGGFASLTGRDGKWIQARTKGPGHGSISRAFYARKCLIDKILQL